MKPKRKVSPVGSGLAWLRNLIDTRPWPDECAEYPFGRFGSGYGQTYFEGHNQNSHRVAYILAHGAIPDGLEVLHSCIRTRACCNPAHLSLGTHQDNMNDRSRDGTAAFGDLNGSIKHPDRLKPQSGDDHWSRRTPSAVVRGEPVGGAKLTEADVREIRRRAGAESITALSEHYRVSKSTINLIVARKRWAHVDR